MKLLHTTAAALCLALIAPLAAAQDYTHPKDMALPAPASLRPDPASLRLALDNGITAYVAEDHRAPLARLSVYLKVGSVAAPGLASALRRGPGSMKAGEFAEALEALYADYRVHESHEETVVEIDVPVEHGEKALNLVAQTLEAPAFAGGETETDSPAPSTGGIDYSYTLNTAIRQFEDRLFAGHVYGAAPEARSNGGAADPQARYAGYLRGSAVTLAYAGDFSAKRARRDLARAFAGLSADDAVPEPSSIAPLLALKEREVLLQDVPRDQGWVVIGHELPVVPIEDQARLEVMDYILGAYHLDSRLYRNSRELRGLTNDNSSFLEPGVRGPGVYSMRTYGRPEAVRLLVDITFRELELLRTTLPTEDELFVAKGALVDGLYARRYATGLDAAKALAAEWSRYGSHERSTSYPDRVATVSREDVQAMAQKYLHPERMIVSVVGPLERISAAPQIESEPQLEAWKGSP